MPYCSDFRRADYIWSPQCLCICHLLFRQTAIALNLSAWLCCPWRTRRHKLSINRLKFFTPWVFWQESWQRHRTYCRQLYYQQKHRYQAAETVYRLLFAPLSTRRSWNHVWRQRRHQTSVFTHGQTSRVDASCQALQENTTLRKVSQWFAVIICSHHAQVSRYSTWLCVQA